MKPNAGWRCEFLEENTEPGFRWSCGLRRELGSWDAVHSDPRYIEGPGAKWGRFGTICGDFPDPDKGELCRICGSLCEGEG